jgi:hypothetical protein
VGFPIGTPVTVPSKALRSTLGQAIPANSTELTDIEVRDAFFVAALEKNDVLHVRHPGLFGGIPDLFKPDTTPPPQFTPPPPQPDFDYLNYLASWIALPLRAEKPVAFHRAFFHAAIPLYPQRSTLIGMEKLLRAWLKGDQLETGTAPPLLIATDLTRTYNDVETIFQLAPEGASGRAPDEIYAQLGVNTVLGEGPPFFFIVDLITNPALRELRHPAGLDVFQRTARLLLDAEKPAYTYYQLRVRAHTMQLAPAGVVEERYAQVGETTLLWDEPWVFDSEG